MSINEVKYLRITTLQYQFFIQKIIFVLRTNQTPYENPIMDLSREAIPYM
jgi:hypothetical protein